MGLTISLRITPRAVENGRNGRETETLSPSHAMTERLISRRGCGLGKWRFVAATTTRCLRVGVGSCGINATVLTRTTKRIARWCGRTLTSRLDCIGTSGLDYFGLAERTWHDQTNSTRTR